VQQQKVENKISKKTTAKKEVSKEEKLILESCIIKKNNRK
jgi:hypothetical protein